MPVWMKENICNQVLLERGTNPFIVQTGLKREVDPILSPVVCSCSGYKWGIPKFSKFSENWTV